MVSRWRESALRIKNIETSFSADSKREVDFDSLDGFEYAESNRTRTFIDTKHRFVKLGETAREIVAIVALRRA